MKYFFCLVFLSGFFTAHAQISYSNVAAKFQVFYNAQTPDSIFYLYAPALKIKLPLEKTRSLLDGMHVEYNDLKSLQLLKEDSGFNSYKAVFKDQTLMLLLSLDDQNQIEGFRLVPYQVK